jgi:amino acid adenylation domain-containing protein
MSPVADFYPLSPMQEGMLFHTLYAPDSGVYVTQVNLSFPAAELDLPAFEESWRRVVERHAVLRTRFAWEGLEAPIQAVEREVALPIEQRDWRHLRPAEGRRRLAAYQRSERARRFDLSRAPLLRLGILQLAGGVCWGVWSFHHIVLDGRSVSLVLEDVAAIYRSLAKGVEPALPPVRPFRDYIVWLKRQDLALAEDYWRGVLRGFRAPTPLPSGHNGGESPAAGYGMQHRALPAPTTAALTAWGRRAGLTLNTLSQGVWALLLGRYSGEEDVAYGVAVLGRPADLAGAESIVGLFINTLLLRVAVPAYGLLVPWLQDLQAAWARSRRFEPSPLVQVQTWSEVPRGIPLFETLLNFIGGPRAGSGAGDASDDSRAAGHWEVETQAQSHVAITLDVVLGVTAIELHLRYDRARFGDTFITRLLGHLATLFAALPEEPHRRLGELPMLSAAERFMVTAEWNDTTVDRRSEPALLHARFERWAVVTPEAVALVADGRCLTYGGLAALAGALARRLVARGVEPESRVGVLLERSVEMVVALLAVLQAGGAYLPLDPEHPAERLSFQAAEGGVAVVLTERDPRGSLPKLDAPILAVDITELWAEPAVAALRCAATPENLAYVIYTSGSTGRPKGAMVSHRAICNRLDWQEETYRLSTAGRVLQKTPFSFDVSLWEFFWPLSTGACLVLAPPGAQRDPARLLDVIVREEITDLHFVPSLLHFFLEVEGVASATSLKRVIASGEALSAELAERFHAALPSVFPTVLPISLHNLYGPTEAAVDVTAWPCEREGGARAVPIGRPIANTTIHLLDARGRPVPLAVAGELHIGGVGLARGYQGRPDLTAERFVPDASVGVVGERLYRTGDLARRGADGRIEYLGRIDQQVKVRGIRIELGEIEAMLVAHPGVRQAAVAAREDGPAGQRLIAYIVPETPETPETPANAAPDLDGLRAFARERLPEAMIPAALVLLAALPLTASGKLDRRALPEPAADLAPAGSASMAPEPARDEVEATLVEIWETLLHRRPIGIRDDFFALGGHSLLAVRLMGRLLKRFDRRVPLALFVENRTIERLAAALREPAREERRSPLVALQPAGDRPAFFCVHPIGGQVLCFADLARHMGTEQPVYGLEAPGLDAVGKIAPSIPEMAAAYLAAVRGVQPGGPYLFGGWSMGGIIAFEMARQLHEDGEEAALVAILDSWSPVIHRIVPDDAYLLSELVKDHSLQRGAPPALSYEQLAELAPEARLRRVLEVAQDTGLVATDADVSWLRRSLVGYRARREALLRYRPTPYPGSLLLLRAREADEALLATLETALGIDVRDPQLGWGAYATGPVAVETVPGNHSTMCSEPNVHLLARSLHNSIERALSGQEVRR